MRNEISGTGEPTIQNALKRISDQGKGDDELMTDAHTVRQPNRFSAWPLRHIVSPTSILVALYLLVAHQATASSIKEIAQEAIHDMGDIVEGTIGVDLDWSDNVEEAWQKIEQYIVEARDSFDFDLPGGELESVFHDAYAKLYEDTERFSSDLCNAIGATHSVNCYVDVMLCYDVGDEVRLVLEIGRERPRIAIHKGYICKDGGWMMMY